MSMFSDHLRALREKEGLTQIEFANVIGKSMSAYRKWETGENEPSMQFLIELAQYFHVSLDYLVGLADENGSAPILKDIGDDLDGETRVAFNSYSSRLADTLFSEPFFVQKILTSVEKSLDAIIYSLSYEVPCHCVNERKIIDDTSEAFEVILEKTNAVQNSLFSLITAKIAFESTKPCENSRGFVPKNPNQKELDNKAAKANRAFDIITKKKGKGN